MTNNKSPRFRLWGLEFCLCLCQGHKRTRCIALRRPCRVQHELQLRGSPRRPERPEDPTVTQTSRDSVAKGRATLSLEDSRGTKECLPLDHSEGLPESAIPERIEEWWGPGAGAHKHSTLGCTLEESEVQLNDAISRLVQVLRPPYNQFHAIFSYYRATTGTHTGRQRHFLLLC